MDKQDLKIIFLFAFMAIVFGVGSVLIFYVFEVGIFDLSYKAVSIIALIYTCLMLYYFRKSKLEFTFSNASLRALIFNFIFSLILASTIYFILAVVDPQFMTYSIASAIKTLMDSKDAYLEMISSSDFSLRIQLIQETTALSTATDFFIKFSGVGIFYALILSLLFRKKNETTN